MNTKSYEILSEAETKKHEDVCIQCGRCCGSEDGDPCIFLKKDPDGKYFCKTYTSRLGAKETINGNFFNCIPIEKAIQESDSVPSDCPYRKILE